MKSSPITQQSVVPEQPLVTSSKSTAPWPFWSLALFSLLLSPGAAYLLVW